MRLKDRIRDFSTSQTKNVTVPAKSKDYCHRYQKGKCRDGHGCRYEHRCAICNKYGHGAHICHHRNRGNDHDYERHNDKYHYYANKRDKSPKHYHKEGKGLGNKKSHK